MVNLFGQRSGLRGRSDRRKPGAGGGRGRTTGANRLRADRLRAELKVARIGGQAKIVC